MTATGATTVTSLTETIYGSWISPKFQENARHFQNPNQFCAAWDPQNGSSRVSVPRYKTNEGAADDHGVAVDSEYDATEATEIVPVELETEESHFDIREYGMARKLSYTAAEDTIAGDVLGYIQRDEALTLMTAFNDDVTANYADFSHSSGTPGSAMEIEDLDDALFDLAGRGVMGSLVGVLSLQQARDWDASIKATDTSMAVYAGAADRIMAAAADSKQGRNPDGLAFSYRGVPFYQSGLTDTANTGADDVGAIYVRGDDEANRPSSAIGKGTRRPFSLEFFRFVLERTVVIVGTMRQGSGVTQDFAGQAIITKAAA